MRLNALYVEYYSGGKEVPGRTMLKWKVSSGLIISTSFVRSPVSSPNSGTFRELPKRNLGVELRSKGTP